MRRLLLSLALTMLLPGLWTVRDVDAGVQDKQQNVTSQASTPAYPPGYAGSEACATCHQEQVDKFSANPHTKMALMHDGKGVTCENCHGPGQAHIDAGGDATKIFQFSNASAKQIDEKCLTCHAGAHPNFEHSAHGEAAVDCLGCHSVHKSAERRLPAQDIAAEALLHLPHGHQSGVRSALSSQSG